MKLNKKDTKPAIKLGKARGVAFAHGLGVEAGMPADMVTVAVEYTGPGNGKFAVAVHNPEDGKFRKHVGKFLALERLNNTDGMPCRIIREEGASRQDVLQRFAQDLADALYDRFIEFYYDEG